MDNLRQFVREHQVSWEAHPIFETVDGQRVPVGYELELHAIGNGTRQTVNPDSPTTIQLFRGLETLAEPILPPELNASRVEILPFDHSVHLDPHEHLRPQVLLKLRIFHAMDYFQAASSNETQCLHELENSFKALGATKRS